MACESCASVFGETGDPIYPDVTITDRWVAVRFHARAPYLVLDEGGTVTERFTLPSAVAQLPLPAAARPVRIVELPRGAA